MIMKKRFCVVMFMVLAITCALSASMLAQPVEKEEGKILHSNSGHKDDNQGSEDMELPNPAHNQVLQGNQAIKKIQ